MQVRNRFGGVQNLPDHIARELIKAGTVTAVAVSKPVERQDPKPRKGGNKPEAAPEAE